MKRFLLTAAALALLTTTASAGEFTAADIAKLPPDMVETVKRHCAGDWPTDFRMREYCENKQYQALQNLIVRGSLRGKGDAL